MLCLMDFLLLTYAYIALFISGILCYFFQDAAILNRGVIGWLRLRLCQALRLVSNVCPSPVSAALQYSYNYLFHTRNRVFQLFYLVLVFLGHVFAIRDGLPFLRQADPQATRLFWAIVLLVINLTLFVLCCFCDPGEIDQSNLDAMSRIYDYDNCFYHPGIVCDTCHLVKPARSKHCSVYKRCIFKFDHYCIWIRNCVGGYNHRFFVALLLSLCLMCLHGVVAIAEVLSIITHIFGYWNLKYLDSQGHAQPMDYTVLCQTLFMRHPRLVFILVGLVFVICIVGFFTGYHVALTLSNQTTNERYKRYHLRKEGKPVQPNVYDRGLWQNILEDLLPLNFPASASKRSL